MAKITGKQIVNATSSLSGAESAADKTKLDGVTPGAAVASVSGTAPIVSSGGTTPAISITAATDVAAGSMSAADKTKLDGMTPGAAVASVSGTDPITSSGGTTPAIGFSPGADVPFNGHKATSLGAPTAGGDATNKTYVDMGLTAAVAVAEGYADTKVASVSGTAPIVSSGGTTPAISITAATDVAAGSMSAADKTKLDGMTPGAAVASVSGAAPIVSSGGTTPTISITAATDVAAGSMSAADKTKLDGITAGAAASTRSKRNKYMAAETTTADGNEACATAIGATPFTGGNSNGGYVNVLVNGIDYQVGDGVKTKDCYFSGNGGTTARAINAIVSGDKLYWNGSIAGFQLAASTDLICFNYDESAP